jgi:predicted neutral ceramidase superfamily lipid hydrolase
MGKIKRRRKKKLSPLYWIGLIFGYLISGFLAFSILDNGLSSVLILLLKAIGFCLLATMLTFIFSLRISIKNSTFMGFVFPFYYYVNQIHIKAKSLGRELNISEIERQIFFILITMLTWFCYNKIRKVFEKLIFNKNDE